MRVELPSISYIVARTQPGNVIGRDNKLPWHQRADLQRFKQVTRGHVMIMGRRTFDSIGRPLPNRTSVVLSRETDADIPNTFWHVGETTVLNAQSKSTALFFADVISYKKGLSDVFVIGGSQIFAQFNDLFNKIYLTEILTPDKQPGDAVFDYKFDRRQWRELERVECPAGPEDDHPSRFIVLERKRRWIRYVEVNDYFTDKLSSNAWRAKQLDLFYHAIKQPKPTQIPYQYQMELSAA